MIEAVLPIPLFGDEPPSILSGRQTLIRRIKKEETFPFGDSGSLLWIQEPLGYEERVGWVYTDGSPCAFPPGCGTQKYIPSILMPRMCSRGILVVDEWWEEPLHDATPDDMRAEDCPTERAFRATWKAHYPDAPFGDNPDTWVMYVSLR